jgi:ATP-dependent DNA helicase RecQ
LHPKKKFEGKDYAHLVLRTVEAVKEKFKAEYIAKILVGELTNTIKQYKHHQLDMFGEGKEEGFKFWVDIIRQCLIHKLLEKEIVNYGILKLTDKGKEFLKKPYSITFYEFHNYDEYEEEAMEVSGGTAAVDEVLFNMLKDLRKEVAQEHGVPPYIIFQDISLEDMSIHYPVSLQELEQMTGVGKGKAEKYGKKFIEIIKKYVEENEIERPQDLIIKSSVQKSAKKVNIIKGIDRKIPLEEIAESLGLDFYEMLDELESIVLSGTKINLDYYINDVIEEEKQEELTAFLKEFEGGGDLDEVLDEAFDEFGDYYSEEEIRLMRIKFIADFAN